MGRRGKLVSSSRTRTLTASLLSMGRAWHAGALYLFEGKVKFSKDGSLNLSEGSLTVVKGRIGGNDPIRGRVQIKAGSASVSLEKSWASVMVTPSYNTRAWVEHLTDKGFTIKVDSAPESDREIHWLAI